MGFGDGGAGEGCTNFCADVNAPALVAAAKELVRWDAVSMCRPADVAHICKPVLGLDWRWVSGGMSPHSVSGSREYLEREWSN
jgi:hypothetical protein